MELSTLLNIKSYAETAANEHSDPLHTFTHLGRVAQNANLIVKILGKENELDGNLLQAACFLHDIPINIPKKYFLSQIGKHLFEQVFIKKYLPGILEKFNLEQEEKEILFEAILDHPFSIPYRLLNEKSGFYARILQDADSLDYFSFEREKSVKESKNKSLYLYILAVVSSLFFAFGRKNIRIFLNFPEIAKKYQF